MEETYQERLFEHYKSINVPKETLRKLCDIFVENNIPSDVIHKTLRIMNRYNGNAVFLEEMTEDGLTSDYLNLLMPALEQPAAVHITIKKVKLENLGQ